MIMHWIHQRSRLNLILCVILMWNSIHHVTCENPDDPRDASKDTAEQPKDSQDQPKPTFDHFTHPVNPENPSENKVDIGFIHAFVASLSVIIVSELGDKTFFIAAIMAMRHSRMTVYLGAMLALGLMTVLSCFLGYATTVIPRTYTYYISTALFALFGVRMLKEGYDMDPNEGQEELEEVQAELKKKDEELENERKSTVQQDPESGVLRGGGIKTYCLGLLSAIFLQSFTLTFLAEWGDRSQLTTILLAARENVYGVAIGGTIGHGLCTALAVLGGRLIAQKISVRTVTIIGGVVFLIFALSSLFLNP